MEVGLMKAPRRWLRATRASGLVSLAALGAIAVLINCIAAGRYQRWDWTTDKRYTLSPATVQTLHDLPETVHVWVLLGALDPLGVSVKQLLVAYATETRKLEVHTIDPDRDVAALEDVRKRFHIETGRAEDGRVVADAVAVVASGDRHWFVAMSDLVEATGDDARVQPKQEEALTSAIRHTLGGDTPRVCFTSGHGELNTEDPGDRGAGALRGVLEKDNYEVRVTGSALPLPAGAGSPFDGCSVVVVAGLAGGFGADDAERLRTYALGGGSLLVAAGPIGADSPNGMALSGLDRVLAPFGIAWDEDVVIEQAENAAMADSNGVRFLAHPHVHAITVGLAKEGARPEAPRIIVEFARSMHHAAGADAAVPQTLLSTSDRAFGLVSVRGAADWKKPPIQSPTDISGPLTLAMAAERPAPRGAPRGPRLVVLGTSSLLESASFREALPLRGGAFLVEGALSWLASRPQVLDIPRKPAVASALRLTEQSREDVRRYVLFFMPAAVALLGLALGLYRRSTEGSPWKRRRNAAREGDR